MHDEFTCVFSIPVKFKIIFALEKCKIECHNALNILEINLYLALTSYCNTIGQSNNA